MICAAITKGLIFDLAATFHERALRIRIELVELRALHRVRALVSFGLLSITNSELLPCSDSELFTLALDLSDLGIEGTDLSPVIANAHDLIELCALFLGEIAVLFV